MAMATCWKCGAQVAGATCPWCGSAQQQGAAQGPSYSAQAGQPAVSQASMSVRSPQPPGGGYAAGGQYPYPQAGQPGSWQGQQPAPGQGNWQGNSQPAPGYAQPGYAQPGYPQPGSQGPSAYQQKQAAMGMSSAAPATGQLAGLALMGVLLGLAGGVVGGVIGALIWAFFLEFTKTNIPYIAVGLGFLVGIGVLLGARGQRNIVLAGLAAVLGLLSFFLALYFRLSLETADLLGEGTNLFALPVGDFFDALKLYLQDNPINYLFFVLVPLIAGATSLRGRTSRRRRW